MFNNEVKLIKDLNRAGGVSSRVLQTCRIRLWRCAATRPGTIATGQDASGSYYATNSNTTSQNICRVILVALYTGDHRFAKSLNGVNGRNKDFHRQGIPFVEGDVINFIVVVRPPETQHQLTGRTAYR
jgi:hypothetical protein